MVFKCNTYDLIWFSNNVVSGVVYSSDKKKWQKLQKTEPGIGNGLCIIILIFIRNFVLF